VILPAEDVIQTATMRQLCCCAVNARFQYRYGCHCRETKHEFLAIRVVLSTIATQPLIVHSSFCQCVLVSYSTVPCTVVATRLMCAALQTPDTKGKLRPRAPCESLIALPRKPFASSFQSAYWPESGTSPVSANRPPSDQNPAPPNAPRSASR
jgi:hypothetical protein